MPWDVDPNSPTYGTYYPDTYVPPPPTDQRQPSVIIDPVTGATSYGNQPGGAPPLPSGYSFPQPSTPTPSTPTHALGDGSAIPLNQWNKLDPKYQQIGNTQGFEPMKQALLEDGYTVNGVKKAGRYIAGGKVEMPETVKLTTVKGEQAQLKEQYDAQQKLNELPLLDRLKSKLWKQMSDPGYSTVIKLPNGQYSRVVSGEAPAVGLSGGINPQTINTVAKVAVGLGVGVPSGLKLREAIQDYKDKTGKEPTASNIVAIDTENNAAFTLGKFGQEIMLPEDFKKVEITQVPGTDINAKVPELKGFSQGPNLPEIPGTSQMKPQILVLDTPALKTEAGDNYLMAQTNANQATKKVVDTIPVDFNKMLQDAVKANNQKEIENVFSAVNRTLPTWKPARRDAYLKAHEEYILKQQILANARKSYVQSVNPSPIQGNMTDKAVYILGATKIATYIKSNKKLSPKQKTKLLNQTLTDLKEATKTQTLTQGKVSELSQTRTGIKTDTKTQTQTQTKELTKTSDTTQTSDITRTPDLTRTNELTKTREGEATRSIPKPLKLKIPKSELETKAHTPDDYKSAVTWKSGIGWWLLFPDGTNEFSRKKPEGVKEVPGPDRNKPNATIQVYRPHGTVRVKEFSADMGIMDVVGKKQGKRILSLKFKQDIRQRTRQPVQLGRPRFKSVREGKIYRTRIGNGQIISREPLK